MDEILPSASIDTTDLRTLVSHTSWIHGDLKLEEAYEEFQRHHFEFVAVLDDDRRVLGLASREELGMLLSIRFGRELFARKQVREHLSRPTTTVKLGDRVSSVLQGALAREEPVFFDDVVLVGQDLKYLGLIDMRTLIRFQHRFLSETIRDLRSQGLEISARQAQMEEELRLASKLQQAMFQGQPSLCTQSSPGLPGCYRLHYHYQPASLVGGDYFHAFEVDEGVIGVMLCDVMGHGVRSALVTAMLRALAETHLPVASDPGSFLCHLNRDLAMLLGQVEDSLFVTAQYLLLDFGNRLFRFANAGHHETLLINRISGRMELLRGGEDIAGPPLGIIENAVFGTGTAELTDGDLFLMYTDGVFEVFSPEGEMYGHERLMSAIKGNSLLPMPELFRTLLEELGRFAGGTSFSDDICIVGVDVAF